MSRSRNYTFTLNNYTNKDEQHIQKLHVTGKVRSIEYGREVGEKGTPHLQGFLTLHNAKTLRAVSKLLPKAHLERMKGTIAQNKEYCEKDGDVFTFGTHPVSNKEKGEKEKERWQRINELTINGDLDTLKDEYPGEWNRGYRRLKNIAKDYAPTPAVNDTQEHEWYHGKTGTGKSLKARTENPDAYIKLNNKWWDGYDGEEVVILDDLDKYDVKLGGHLKRWSDHYPFPAEYKGGVMKIRPRKIIVTSNYAPEEIWDDERTIGPLRRRFKVTEFKRLTVQEPHEHPNASYAPKFNPPPMDL